jgi:hypothetical protein
VVYTLFEKTKPICKKENRRKVLYERILWKSNGLWNSKKQTQFYLAPRFILGVVEKPI